MRSASKIFFRLLCPAILLSADPVFAQEEHYASCDDYLPPAREISGILVGPSSCLMRETIFTLDNREYIRIDMGLNGKVEGYVTKSGEYHQYLTNTPELIFSQSGNHGRQYQAVADYHRTKGNSILLVFPKYIEDWNGKMWVTVHGRGSSLKSGTLRPWEKYLDTKNPAAVFDKINRVMLSQGYALAVTHRTTEEGTGEVSAILEDGTTADWITFNDNVSIIKDFTAVAETAVSKRLGSTPEHTYFYGHSAGARIGRNINYTKGLNIATNGNTVFDGFLLDDSATGLWLPVVIQDGVDTMLATDDMRNEFKPQIELVHLLYQKDWERAPDKPDWVADEYLVNKRRNAKILMDKGLGSRFRIYEIKQISHNGGERLADGRYGKIRILDISLLIDGVIDILDDYIVNNIQLPQSRSDWDNIGDHNNDNVIENPAISFPEVACPLGIFYPWPQRGSGYTAFAGFTGAELEPVDVQGVYIDMNQNGSRDLRETPTTAWQRLGLLTREEDLTREKYVSCIHKSGKRLYQAGFFSAQTLKTYHERAQKQNLMPASLE